MEDENENDIYKISEALKKENAISDEISINKINNNEINEINTNSKGEKGQIDEDKNLLSKKRLRYKVIKNYNI